MSTLKYRHAIITGAARGIGAAIAHSLAAEGANLTLIGRNEKALYELVAHLPGQGLRHVQVVDVAEHEAMHRAIGEAVQALGPAHILVNNAGQALSQSIDKTDLALWQQMLAVNLTGTYNGIHAALPSLRSKARAEDPARIINIASTAGLQGYPHVSAYTAAKHGVIGLTRALALELARQHITVNAVCPGYTETDIAAQAIDNVMKKTGKSADEARHLLAARSPQQRLIQPEEVASAVLWLCQRGSASVNGQTIVIDGGELAG
jgi:NAD(P)-dependent dehydrogenase (short-subunit alcohol dehydrogenase family)